MVKEDLIDSFWLYGKNGRKHRAHTYQERIDTSSMSGRSSIPGMKVCRLNDGSPLNYKDENTYEIVTTGEIVTRTEK